MKWIWFLIKNFDDSIFSSAINSDNECNTLFNDFYDFVPNRMCLKTNFDHSWKELSLASGWSDFITLNWMWLNNGSKRTSHLKNSFEQNFDFLNLFLPQAMKTNSSFLIRAHSFIWYQSAKLIVSCSSGVRCGNIQLQKWFYQKMNEI